MGQMTLSNIQQFEPIHYQFQCSGTGCTRGLSVPALSEHAAFTETCRLGWVKRRGEWVCWECRGKQRL